MSPRRAGWGWVIALGAVALGLLGVAGVTGVSAYQMKQELARAEAAETVRMAVDLSKVGEYRGVVREECWKVLHRGIDLVLTPPVEGEEASRLLAGLTGRVKIAEASGDVGLDQEIRGEELAQRGISYACLSPAGEYTLTLTVTQPAPALAGMQQELVGRYQLCCEGIPAAVARLIAIGSGAIGVPLGVVAGVMAVRRRRGAK